MCLRHQSKKNAQDSWNRRILGPIRGPKKITSQTRLIRQACTGRRKDQVMINSRLRVAMWQTVATGVLGVGAFLMFPHPSIAAESTNAPTFTKDVAPILQAKCEECHHKGTAAPISLSTYEETRKQAALIKERVASRMMPPWHLDRTVGIQRFKNDRSLTDEQIATIVRWVDSGTPFGDPKELPP